MQKINQEFKKAEISCSGNTGSYFPNSKMPSSWLPGFQIQNLRDKGFLLS